MLEVEDFVCEEKLNERQPLLFAGKIVVFLPL